jgi:hypothetical protein
MVVVLAPGSHKRMAGDEDLWRIHGNKVKKGDPGSKEGSEDVQEVRQLTPKLKVLTTDAGEGRGRRNRRKTMTADEGEWRAWRRTRTSQVDSLRVVVEGSEARRLVVVALLGVVAAGGSTVSGGGAVGFLPFACSARRKEARGRRGEGGRFGGDAVVQRGRVVGEDKGEDGVVEVVRCDVVRVKLTLSA